MVYGGGCNSEIKNDLSHFKKKNHIKIQYTITIYPQNF